MDNRKTRPQKIMADRLRQSEIFGVLSEEDLLALVDFCTEQTFHEGATVLKEDDPAVALFIVERGKIALEKRVQVGRHSTPRNATIGYVDPGEIAGFSTLSSPHFYSTSAVCVEPTRAIVIEGEPLRSYLHQHPEAGLAVMDAIAELIGSRYRTATNTLTYFLSIVSHELRGPLAAIENYLRTMLGGFAGDLNPRQERMVKRSILRVTDLSTLIGDVVDLARMRPEQIQADFEWFDPSEVASESIEDVRLAAAEKEIQIKVEPPLEFKPIVGARRRTRQVFTNLLNNAIKFSPEGCTVRFRARYDRQHVIFEVEDQGPGIPEEDLPHIFKDFFRASNVSGVAGTGLGLSIAKKVIDAHNGQILVSNLTTPEGGTGSRFRVLIPLDLKTPEMRRREWRASVNEEPGS